MSRHWRSSRFIQRTIVWAWIHGNTSTKPQRNLNNTLRVVVNTDLLMLRIILYCNSWNFIIFYYFLSVYQMFRGAHLWLLPCFSSTAWLWGYAHDAHLRVAASSGRASSTTWQTRYTSSVKPTVKKSRRRPTTRRDSANRAERKYYGLRRWRVRNIVYNQNISLSVLTDWYLYVCEIGLTIICIF